MSKDDDNIVLQCRHVGKEFHYYQHGTTLRERVLKAVKRQTRTHRPLFSLVDFNLTARAGESVALVGANGSGKSTALRIMARIYEPTYGTIDTLGRVSAVIELGAGFNGELTGRENIRLYGSIMGLDKREILGHMDEIVAFSGVGRFLDMPVKYYSSGMFARLAFSIALCTSPDILLLDEVLAVGDAAFRERCLDRLRSFVTSGGTLITASHDLNAVRDLCSTVLWLDAGRVHMTGDPVAILGAYEEAGSLTSLRAPTS